MMAWEALKDGHPKTLLYAELASITGNLINIVIVQGSSPMTVIRPIDPRIGALWPVRSTKGVVLTSSPLKSIPICLIAERNSTSRGLHVSASSLLIVESPILANDHCIIMR